MKILIVGAGPVGCYAAQLLKKIGHHPILLEEHTSVGKPVQCAGIVSKNLIRKIKSYLTDQSIVSQIDGFYISSGWTNDFLIKTPQIAFIVDREKFDLSLGVDLDIRFSQRVSFIEKIDKRYLVKTTRGDIFEAELLIGADGPDSVVRRFLLDGYSKNKGNLSIKMNEYFGMQYQIRLNEDNKIIPNHLVKVFFDHAIPFFVWVIPENRRILRVGIVSDHPKQFLDDFISSQAIKGQIIDTIAGKIVIGLIPTYYQNMALVGDAACQIKPLTGGGLSYGMQSAQILVDSIRDGRLEKYDRYWKKEFGREIQFGLKARRVYENLNDKNKKQVFHLFKKNADLIEQVADFDHHSTLFKKAFKKPQLLLDAGKLLRFYWEDMLK